MAPEMRKVRLKIGAGEFETEVPPEELPALIEKFATTLGIAPGKFTKSVTIPRADFTPKKAQNEKSFERDDYSSRAERGRNAKLVLDALNAIGVAGATFTTLRHQVFKATGIKIAASSMGHSLKQLLQKEQIERVGERYRIKATLRAVREGAE